MQCHTLARLLTFLSQQPFVHKMQFHILINDPNNFRKKVIILRITSTEQSAEATVHMARFPTPK